MCVCCLFQRLDGRSSDCRKEWHWNSETINLRKDKPTCKRRICKWVSFFLEKSKGNCQRSILLTIRFSRERNRTLNCNLLGSSRQRVCCVFHVRPINKESWGRVGNAEMLCVNWELSESDPFFKKRIFFWSKKKQSVEFEFMLTLPFARECMVFVE